MTHEPTKAKKMKRNNISLSILKQDKRAIRVFLKWGQATNLDWTEMNRKKHQKILTENTKRITVL